MSTKSDNQDDLNLDEVNAVDSFGKICSMREFLDETTEWNDYLMGTGPLEGKYIPFPLRVQIEISDACNFACAFCYNNSPINSTNSISRGLNKSLMAEIASNNIFELIITGGEPLMDKEYLRSILEWATSNKIAAVIITNGWFLTDSMASMLKEHCVVEVQVSIDGCDPKIHDRFRGKEGAWVRAVNGIKRLCDANINTTIAAVTHKLNLHSIEEYILFCSLLGVNKLILGDVLLYGRASENMADIILSNEEYEHFINVVSSAMKNNHGQMQLLLSSDASFALRAGLKRPRFSCLIRADGSVTPSCLLPISLGNINEDSLSSIWEGQFSKLHLNPEIIQYVESKPYSITPNLKLIRTA